MTRHKTGSRHGGRSGCNPCSRDRHCKCSQCSPKTPYGPTAGRCPTGPTGFGTTGPTGPTGPSDSGHAPLKFSGTIILDTPTPVAPGDTHVAGYLADIGVGSLSLTVGQAVFLVAPNYPVGNDPITFDDLAVLIKSTDGAAAVLPAGATLVVELMRNGIVATGLAVEFPSDGVAGIAFNPMEPAGGLYGNDADLVTILTGETYDLRVSIRNDAATPITVTDTVSVSATLRASAS